MFVDMDFFFFFSPLLNRDIRNCYFKLEISPVKGKLCLTIIKVEVILREKIHSNEP